MVGAPALAVTVPVPEVPKAVVIPTTIPVVGSVGRGLADETPVPPVGSTIGPEDPALGTDGTLLTDSVGSTMLLGNPPLGPVEEMMNGPSIVEVPAEADGAAEDGIVALGDTMVSGSPADGAEDGASEGGVVALGDTIVSGSPADGADDGASEGGDSAAALEEGGTIDGGRPKVEPTEDGLAD